MTGKDFIKPKPEPLDSRALNYKLTKGEMKFAFFYIQISAFIAVTGLLYWILQVATE